MLVNLLSVYSRLATEAGRLDLTVIQFPERKTPAELENAPGKVDLERRSRVRPIPISREAPSC